MHSRIARLNQKLISILRQSHHIIRNHRKAAACKRRSGGGLACTWEAYECNCMLTDSNGALRAGTSFHAGAIRIRSPVRANRCRHLRACSFQASRPTPRGLGVRPRIAPHRYKKKRSNPYQGANQPASSVGRQYRLHWYRRFRQAQGMLWGSWSNPSTVSVRQTRLNQPKEGGQGAPCWPQVAAHKFHTTQTKVPRTVTVKSCSPACRYAPLPSLTTRSSCGRRRTP